MKLANLIGAEFEFPVEGTLEGWAAAATHLFAPGCEGQAALLLASFAAPLMSLFAGGEGGAVVSLVGPRRSGKSTALTAAATVWMMPEEMRLPAGRGDARFRAMAMFGNLPILADRLVHQDPAATRSLLERFLAVADRKNPPFQTLLLSASGLPLLKLADPDSTLKAGLELPVKVPAALIQPKDKNRLEGQLIANRGQAARAWLKHITRPDTMVWARRDIVSRYVALKEKHGLDDGWRFPLRALAALEVAGGLVNETGILEFDTARIVGWAAGHGIIPPSNSAGELRHNS